MLYLYEIFTAVRFIDTARAAVVIRAWRERTLVKMSSGYKDRWEQWSHNMILLNGTLKMVKMLSFMLYIKTDRAEVYIEV